MKYENGGNLRSSAAPQIRRVLSRPKNDQFWRVFYPFQPIFLLFHPPYAYTKPILQKKSGLACIFWPRWRLKVFASTQGGLPPPTQLTNTNIKIMKIRVSWVGQSTNFGEDICPLSTSSYSEKPAITCAIMLTMAIPCLLLYQALVSDW